MTATDSGMSIRVRSGFGYPMDLCHAVRRCPGNTGYRRKRGHPGSCALEALANVQEGCVGTSGLGLVCCCCVARGDQCCWRNNCDVLMTCLFVCTGVADALGNSG
jgi:hypothetical protein